MLPVSVSASAFCFYLLVGLVQARLMHVELNASTPAFQFSRLDNQHIVFVGDSLLRYQYISLVYLIQFGTFYPDDLRPNILDGTTYKSWADFHNGSNSAFGAREHCDCFRLAFDADRIYENRYFFNEDRNISITYIQYFGDSRELHGHWSPSDKESNHGHHPPDTEFQPYRWKYNITDTLTNIVAKLDPQPSILLLNVGHWANKWGDEGHKQSVLSLALSMFDRVIWKTTSYNSHGKPGGSAHEEVCDFPGVECMDIEWTQYLPGADYADYLHFKPRIYTDFNIQFINQLLTKKPLSVGPMEQHMHGHVVVHRDREYVVDKRGILRPFKAPGHAKKKHVCAYAARRKIHMLTNPLLKHLSGEYIRDICRFEG